MSKENPFRASMTRLQIPASMATIVNVGGFEVEADEDRCVEVPKEHVNALMAHGLTMPAEKSEAEAKSKGK